MSPIPLIAWLSLLGPIAPQIPVEPVSPEDTEVAEIEPATSEEERDRRVQFLFTASPFTQLVGSHARGFRATEVPGLDEGRVESNFSSIPTIGVGVGIKTEPCFFDLVASGGVLYNGSKDVSVVAAHARLVGAARFRLGKKVTLGPRLGLAYFGKPQWLGDGDAEFDDSLGWLAGVGFTFGIDKISLAVDIDYIEADFDVDARSSVITNRSKLDLSGIAVQIGVLCRF